MTRLAVDFGTSNTAVAAGGSVLPLQGGAATMPTALFYDPYSKEVLFGHDAVAALIDGRDGRFLRALKSVLGQPILRESRVLGGERTTLLQVIATYIRWLKDQAEAATGETFTTVLSGRPVRFNSRNADYNAQAEPDLAEAYHLAGFSDVSFLPEPEAAALASGGVEQGFGLIVDIGGGTSDYSVFRGAANQIEVLANFGIRLGGTDFDRLLNIDRVMPSLGLGSELKNELGSDTMTAPRALFMDLATWEKIPFQYTGQTRRAVARMARQAIDPAPWTRLEDVLESELAHDIAHAVESAKITANSGTGQGIDLAVVEPGLTLPLGTDDLTRVLGPFAEDIRDAALDAVSAADLAPGDITRVVMVGGSSLMGVIEDAIRRAFPGAEIARREALTAIIDGLALAADP